MAALVASADKNHHLVSRCDASSSRTQTTVCTPSPDLNRPSPPSQQGPSYTPDLGTRPRCRLRTLAFRDPEYRCSWPELRLKVFVTVPAPGRTPPSLVLQKVYHGWTHGEENKTKKKSLYCRYEPSGRDSFGPLTHAVTHHKKRGAPATFFVFARVSFPDRLPIRSHGQPGSDMPPHSAAVSVLHIEAAFIHVRIRPQ